MSGLLTVMNNVKQVPILLEWDCHRDITLGSQVYQRVHPTLDAREQLNK